MKFSSTFIRMSGPIPEVEKCIDQWLGKYYCIQGRLRAKQYVDE